MNKPIKIFIAYSRQDTPYLQELRKHLYPLEVHGHVEIWYDGEIPPGGKWEEHIKDELQAAQIILLLVSANALYSDYFYNQEMTAALKRHENEEAIVIPIILNRCMWDITALGKLQALPKNGKAIEDWKKPQKAYYNIARGIYKWVKMLRVKEKAGIEAKRKKLEKEKRITQLHPQIQKMFQDMVFIEGGSFQMGSEERKYENPVHLVTIPHFEMAKYPVTQAQWRAVVGSNPPELRFKGCDNCPVERVSWEDCKEFIRKLNKLTGEKFRLPSEAEWEFAARGGNKSRGFLYAGSDKIEEVAWYNGNSGNKTYAVGKLKANELGLYDMSGNVWEWCEDDWHDTYNNAPNDGRAWVESNRTASRVLCGGSWVSGNDSCRSAVRGYNHPHSRVNGLGFRCAKTP